LRAGAAGLNYVVEGTISGYLGRIAPNQGGSFALTQFYRSEVTPTAPQLILSLGPEDPQATRGFQYQMLLHSNFEELEFQLDTTFCTNCLLPAAVVQRVGLNESFVTFPSGNAVIQFDPTAITPNIPTQNIQYYH
jgi:hypothetical protein